jgi:predicted component of type VI protein secretion system
MRAAYLVIEGKDNASFLKQVLPTNLTQNVEIVSSSSWYAAFSLAGTIMSERSRPVLLILNANTENPTQIQERQQTLEQLLRPAAASAPYEIIQAVPSLAQIAQAIGEMPSIEQIQKQPLMQQITEFLSSVSRQVA